MQITVHPWSGDVIAPEVQWTNPSEGDVILELRITPVYTDTYGPAYSPIIQVHFSEVISSTTVTTETFGLENLAGGLIPVSVHYSTISDAALITPREPLEQNGSYRVTVLQGVKDLNGNSLAADYTWNFDVGSQKRIYLPFVLR